MTRSEAQMRCTELNGAADGEPEVHWMPRENSPGEWIPIRVRFPGMPGRTTKPLNTAQESRPQPDAGDPQPSHNPLWGTGGGL
jgi:hypothetical protein